MWSGCGASSKAGRHRGGRCPFRVIVHSVVRWVCKGWYEPGWQEKELFELDGAAPDMAKAVIVDVTLEHFVATLAPGDGEVAALLYLEGLEPADRDATSDPSRIEGWWTRWADANIGMATGAAAGKRLSTSLVPLGRVAVLRLHHCAQPLGDALPPNVARDSMRQAASAILPRPVVAE